MHIVISCFLFVSYNAYLTAIAQEHLTRNKEIQDMRDVGQFLLYFGICINQTGASLQKEDQSLKVNLWRNLEITLQVIHFFLRSR